jgi:alpha-D-xyloside xylohydrolase
MPYLYAAAVEAHREGVPMMRAMMLEFPGDVGCDTLDRQYLLGGAVLVVPVLTEDGTADYYLPDGRWTHLLTGEVQTGGRWHRSTHDFLSLPLFARPNSIVVFGERDDRPDYDYTRRPTVAVYALDDGATAQTRVVKANGEVAATITVKRTGSVVDFSIDGVLSEPKFQLVGIKSVVNAERAAVQPDAAGVFLLPSSNTRSLRVQLS